MLPKRSDQKAKDKSSKIRKLNIETRDDIYRTPKFKNGRLPTQYQMFKGEIPELKIKIRVPVLDNNGKKMFDKDGKLIEKLKESTIKYYDCMDAYQKALPGQGFARFMFERINKDGSTTLVDVLMPAFNKDDGKEDHRNHLQRLGIPYVESNQPRGKNTGLIHIALSRIFGFVKNQNIGGIRLGGGLFKGGDTLQSQNILFKSQSQNAVSIIWNEEYLLAYGLDYYDKETGYDGDLMIRRLLPENISLATIPPLQSEIRKKYLKITKKYNEEKLTDDESYNLQNLDNGEWLTDYRYAADKTNILGTNDHINKWQRLSRIEKNALLIATLHKAITNDDPVGYISRSRKKPITFTSRILKLNHEQKLGITNKDFQNLFEAALEKKLISVIDEFVKYRDTIDLSPAIIRYLNKPFLTPIPGMKNLFDKYAILIYPIILGDVEKRKWGINLLVAYSSEDLFQQTCNRDNKLIERNEEGVSLLDRIIELNRLDLFNFTLGKTQRLLLPESFHAYINIAILKAFAEGRNRFFDILIVNGAKMLSEDDAKKLGAKKYFDATMKKMQELIQQHVHNNDLKALNELEKKYSPFFKSAMQKTNEISGNELLVFAARQCNLPMMKWLLKNGASTNAKNNLEFFDALEYGIRKTTNEKDIENIPLILENYKRELLAENSGEISSRILIEDILKDSKKINVSLLKELESQQPQTISSLMHAKFDGVSLLNVSLQHRDLTLFHWLIDHGATFTDSMQEYYSKNNEYHSLKDWIMECITKDDLSTIKIFKEAVHDPAFREIIDTLGLLALSASTGNIDALKFFIESGADQKESNLIDLLYDFIKKSGTPKKVCDCIEYLGDSFEIDAIGVKSDVFSKIDIGIKQNDYESLIRFKKILSPEDWQEYLDRKGRKGNYIELMKNEPYFNEKIKAILYTKDLDASPLMAYSGTLFTAKKEDDKKSDEFTLKKENR